MSRHAMGAALEPESLRRIYDLSGRTAVVTGAASGIGRAIAWGLASFGADLAIFDRDLDGAAACAEAVASETGRRTLALAVEASAENDVRDAMAEVVGRLGAVDVLVNGAGHNLRKPLIEFEPAELDSILAVHVRGAFLGCREAGRVMRRRGRGSIINIASIAGHVGIAEVSAYSAAKGALIQLSRTLALEMAPYGVRVNALSPGYIETPLTRQHPEPVRQRIEQTTPLGRFGKPEELIGAAVFLASDASAFVTGTSLLVDGGWTAQ